MAQYTAYASYVIFFSDPADYAAAVAIAGGVFYNHCPATAKTTFGLTYVTGSLDGVLKGIYGLAPFGIPSVPPGYQVGHPLPSGVFLMDNVDSILVPGQFGVPPSIFPAGPDMLLVWSGVIIQVNAQAGGATPPSGTPIPQRRFITGCEIHGNNAEGGQSGPGTTIMGNRSASRTADGQGMQIRGGISQLAFIRRQAEYITGFTTKTTWERFYVRVNTFGTNICGIWSGGPSTALAGNTAHLRIDNATGLLKLYVTTGAIVETLRATGTHPLIAGTWYKIHVIILYNNGVGTDGRLRVWINNVLEIDYTDATGDGLDAAGLFHDSSRLGQNTTTDAVWSIDFDDWISADVPTNGGSESLDSPDWQMGSHVRRIDYSSGNITNYTGAVAESVNQGHNPDVEANSRFTSSTALATIEAIGDVTPNQSFPGQIYGIAAIWFAFYNFQNTTSPGRIGYNINGAGYVYVTDNCSNAFVWRTSQVLYRPSALTLPNALTSVSQIKEKSNDVNTNLINAAGCIAEYIGIWGPEDDPAALSYDNPKYRHNARYANTEWGNVPMGPLTAPCFAMGGTYVGNGTSQIINLPAPCHFLWIRGLSGASLGIRVFGASLGGHNGCRESYPPMCPTRLFVDSSGQCQFAVAGANAESNAVGVTYQYIAFCDPGMRFNYCGAYQVPPALTSATLPLFVTDFLAQAGFVQIDNIGNTGTSVTLNYKGTGNGANDGQTLGGVSQANWGSFAAGALTVRANNIVNIQGQLNYSLWRTTDPDCGDIAVQITNYTGDGNALKILNLPLTTGRYPLFALVIPHNSTVGYFRDPSHTGVNSSNATTLALNGTAIMGGGVDQLFLGIALNANLVAYDVFVIMGDSAGWNNGTFNLPNCKPKGPWGVVPLLPSGGILFDGAAIIQAVANLSGIYTLVQDKTADTFYTGAGSTTADLKIPNPTFKTGYIGG